MPNVSVRFLPDFLSRTVNDNNAAVSVEADNNLQVALAVEVASNRIIDSLYKAS